ncbi:hypothetical protein QTP88_004253 [Uroleucon formosanum]
MSNKGQLTLDNFMSSTSKNTINAPKQFNWKVFFTEDRITCFLCKSTGHTSNNCKKINVNSQTATPPIQPKPVEEPPLEEPSLYPHTSISTPEMNTSSPSSKKYPNAPHMPLQIMEGISEDHQTNETPQSSSHNQAEKTEINFNARCEPYKRPLSENSSLTIPASPPEKYGSPFRWTVPALITPYVENNKRQLESILIYLRVHIDPEYHEGTMTLKNPSKSKKSTKTFQTSKTQEDFITLKRCKARIRFLVKNSKASSWKNFVSSIHNQTDFSIGWKKIKSIKGTNRSNVINLLIDSKPSPYDVANSLGRIFHENSCNANSDQDFLNYSQCYVDPVNTVNSLDSQQSLLNSPLKIEELEDALHNCKSKSPGPDGIPYSFIKNFPKNTLNHLLAIYNLIWDSNVFPESWKHGYVIPILKPNKINS